jgi:hypothetical protein
MAAHARLSESPWFWIYLFGAAALIAMFLIGQKADTVQAQRDANFTRRQHSLERQAAPASEPAAEAEAPSADTRYVDFKIFYAIIGAVTVFAWVMHWRQYFVRRNSLALQKPV